MLILGLKAPQTPRIAELVCLIVGLFLIFNKVWSPQYSLWFVVPAVLALPYWRLLLSWMVVDMAVWPVLMWHMMGTENMGVPGELLNLVVLTRDGLIVAMVVPAIVTVPVVVMTVLDGVVALVLVCHETASLFRW